MSNLFEVLWLGAAVLAVGIHFYLQERNKRKVATVLHIQGRTEEAETFDFAVTLFEDESVGKWEERIQLFCSIQERRRAFNNERMAKAMEEHRKAFLAQQKKSETLTGDAAIQSAKVLGIPTKV